MPRPHSKRFAIYGLCAAALVCSLFAPVPVRAADEMEPYPVVRLRALDKVTARTSTFDVEIDTTVRFGPIYIRPRACRKAPPIAQPEAASFLQIWETVPNDGPRWIFSGWMFASSPALSSMDHAVYDVWVLDCLERPGRDTPTEDELSPDEPAPDEAVQGEAAPGRQDDVIEREILD